MEPKDLSKVIGCSLRTAYNKLEDGNFTIDQLSKLSKYLQLDFSEVINLIVTGELRNYERKK